MIGRFVIKEDKIEVWRTNGNVSAYPRTLRNMTLIQRIITPQLEQWNVLFYVSGTRFELTRRV